MIDWLRRTLFDNLALKGIALTLSAVVFLVSHGQRQGMVRLEVPIQVVVPQGFVLQGKPPPAALVQLRGSLDVLRELDAKGLSPVHLLADGREGLQQLDLRVTSLHLPDSIEVLSIQPSSVPVHLDPVVSATVPVATRHRLRGQLPNGLRLGAVRSDPPQVLITGPRSHVERIRELSPSMINLIGHQTSFSEARTLSLPPGLDLHLDPAEVIVHIEVLARSESLRVQGVRVLALNLARPHVISPPSVDLVLLGAPEALASINRDTLMIAFDAQSQQDTSPQTSSQRILPEHIINLPEGVTIDDTRLPTILLLTQDTPPPVPPVDNPPKTTPPPQSSPWLTNPWLAPKPLPQNP